MYCLKVQASANMATVLDPSTSHLTDALRIKASHVLVSTGDTSGRESKEEGKGSKSSWFQRLKPRNDMELFKGAVSEAPFELSKMDKGCPVSGISEGGARSVQPDCVSYYVGSRPRPNSSSAPKCQRTLEEKVCGEAERQRNEIAQEKALKIEIGRSIASSAVNLSADLGFGPWVNLSIGRRSEAERTSSVSKTVVDAAMSGQAVCSSSNVQENSNLALNALPKCSLGMIQGEATTSPALCKPSLSPMNNKVGLPPRPPSQKFSGFSSPSKIAALASGPGRGVLHQRAIDNQPIGQTLTAPATQLLDVQDRESGQHGEARVSRIGSSLQKSKVVEGSISDISWHSKVLVDRVEQLPPNSPTRMSTSGLSIKQQPRPIVGNRGNASITPGQHIGSCSDTALGRMLEDGALEQVRGSVLLSTPRMDKCVDAVPQTSKSSLKNGSMLQAASLEHTKSLLQAAGGSHHGTRVDGQAANASISATLPWELFVEPAGASKKAREQFVEVYNRARDELKNQRLLNTSRTSSRELDGGPKLTLGSSGATSEVRVERQSMQLGQHISAPMQFQGKNTKLEYQSFPHPSGMKEQNAAESFQCKQVEGFLRVQPLPEGHLSLSHKTAVQEGMMEIPVRRMGEGLVVHAKESRSEEKEGQSFSSNSARKGKELVSKLDNDIKCIGFSEGPRDRQQQNNDEEPVTVLGKRSRITFEDHAMSLVAEKSATSRGRTQSKPDLWLQRWHSTSKHNPNGLSTDAYVTDGKRSDSHSYQTLGLKKFREEDSIGVFGRASGLAERVKSLKTSTSKALPSAAAMAIVGTAARQFCSSQPQSKSSFAFWSGFGMQTYRKVEPVQEKGKEKVYEKGVR